MYQTDHQAELSTGLVLYALGWSQASKNLSYLTLYTLSFATSPALIWCIVSGPILRIISLLTYFKLFEVLPIYHINVGIVNAIVVDVFWFVVLGVL